MKRKRVSGGRVNSKRVKKGTERWAQGAIFTNRKFLPELKYFDITTSTVEILQAGSSGGTANTFILTPILGTDYFNRIGRSIQIQSIRVHGYYWPNNITTIVELPGVITQSLILDKQPNGVAAPAMGDIWAGTNGLTSGTGTTYRAPNTRRRYKVLRQFDVYTPQCSFITQGGVGVGTALNTGTGTLNTTVAIDGQSKMNWDYYIDARKAKIGPTIFNGTNGGTYADLEENGLLLWFWWGGPNTAVYSGSWTYSFTSRVAYTDY